MVNAVNGGLEQVLQQAAVAAEKKKPDDVILETIQARLGETAINGGVKGFLIT